MSKFFIPYEGGCPKPIEIKGHRLLIICSAEEDLFHEFETLKFGEVRRVDFIEDEKEMLADLAASINGGVVLAPPGVSVGAMIADLEQELPWLH